MTVFRHPGRHRVAVLVRHGLLPMELGVAHRVMGIAGIGLDGGEPLYEVAPARRRPARCGPAAT